MRLWQWLVMGALLALAGCSSLGPLTPEPAPAPSVRTLDYLNDDVANLLLVFDLPSGIEPIRDATTLSIEVTASGNDERHIRARLAAADADDLAGTLPPPADGHTYYLFGFSDRDRAGLRDIQSWARSLPAGAANVTTVLAPGLCTSGPVDLSTVRISVLPALAGVAKLAPVVANQPLAALIPSPALPACAGHSG